MDTRNTGIASATGAYVLWGLSPIYFVLVGFATPTEILAQRIIWAIPVILVAIGIAGNWASLKALERRDVCILAIASLLLSINWLSFIVAISLGRVAETSLGYFMCPLISLFFGGLVLRERLRGLQWLAGAVAGAGVLYELFGQGEVPVYGLALAFSFGCYGLLKKKTGAAAMPGLLVETSVMLPFALAYLAFLVVTGGAPDRSWMEASLLALGGLVTIVPLLCFAAAARRLPLTLLSFFQYIAPIISLLLALFLYNEHISLERWIAFVCIWIGLLIFSADGVYQQYRKNNIPAPVR
ncbi:MAG: EamA family transporter RarD [Pseudomonadota bacterium]